MPPACADAPYRLAWDRFDRRRPGFGMPILRHLALRRYALALLELSERLDRPGPLAASWSSPGMAHRAHRLGNALGAQHLAMNAFNRNDLTGYRRSLAQAGNAEATAELNRFETRLPHTDARRIGRHRPWRDDE